MAYNSVSQVLLSTYIYSNPEKIQILIMTLLLRIISIIDRLLPLKVLIKIRLSK
jgi:hypothetical protein